MTNIRILTLPRLVRIRILISILPCRLLRHLRFFSHQSELKHFLPDGSFH